MTRPVYSVSVEQLVKALEAAGMVFDHEEVDKAIAVAAQKLADQIDEEIFQELVKKTPPISHEYYEEVTVGVDALWKKLKVLNPYDSGSSLHVAEERYELDGVKYVAYWEICGDSDVPEICIIKEYKR
jgi:hypothetical protein